MARRSSALGGPLEGWRVASKRLGALPKAKRGVLARDCGRGGRGALPLPRAAAVSTGLRVLHREGRGVAEEDGAYRGERGEREEAPG